MQKQKTMRKLVGLGQINYFIRLRASSKVIPQSRWTWHGKFLFQALKPENEFLKTNKVLQNVQVHIP